MARFENERSNNFEDRTRGLGRWQDSVSEFLYKSMWNYMPGFASQARGNGKLSPEENDAFARRNATPAKTKGMTVSDFTPEEWKMVKERGFSLEDIMLLRKR